MKSCSFRKSVSRWNKKPDLLECHAGFPIKPIYKPARILSMPSKEEFIKKIILASKWRKKMYVK